MIALVGYTGFVGSNIYRYGNIDAAFNSKNIQEAFGLEPDVLIYAGLRAEKYLANQDPEKDMETIREAEDNIRKIAPKKLVLISTIDVYRNPVGVDESTDIETKELQAYGANRYVLECWVRENYTDALIIRLPGLFGENIKKNFIYDYINYVPFMLKEAKMEELSALEASIKSYYEKLDNGFYRCKVLTEEERTELIVVLKQIHFSALNFTDSRSIYQFYPLSRLSSDIDIALEKGITLWNPATEPVSAAEVYHYLTGEEFVNELGGTPANYDYHTMHAEAFGGTDGYILMKQEILSEIKKFVGGYYR